MSNFIFIGSNLQIVGLFELYSDSCQIESITNRITIDEALQTLNCVLGEIDGDGTRSTLRQVQSVQSVKFQEICDVTRTEYLQDIEDIEDLFYIVSFGEGQGSAVLGADRRIEEIFAIFDETQLSPEDFNSGSTRASSEDVDAVDLFINQIKSTAIRQITPFGKVYVEKKDPVVIQTKKQSPRVKTKWHQKHPYNAMIPFVEDENKQPVRPLTGCIPLACAQFLTCMHWPQENVLNGEKFDWDLIDQCVYGGNPSQEAWDEVGRYIYKVGLAIDASYSANGTSGNFEKFVQLLFLLTGCNASYIAFDLDRLEEIVCEKGPICMRGDQINKEHIGHGWLVDGWYSYLERTEYVYYRNGAKIAKSATEEWTKLIHCCMGFGGKGDGYYSGTLLNFDLRVPLDKEYIDESAGDIMAKFSGDACLDHNFMMVEY